MSESSEGPRATEIALEQERVDQIYRQLDITRERTRYRLRRADKDPIAGTPGSINEREAMVSGYLNRLTELNGVDERLCFGRLDTIEGERHYIGRIGLSDDNQVSLLMDWRADAAAAFYRATANQPMGVVRRRNISTDDRRVTSIDDDVLMLDAMSDLDLATVTGSDALLTALDSARTGQMRDIVATIQAEQDEIIRCPATGVLVVEGGPGTGKSVVALHRVAYLLYSERARIARSGALVVGPNRTFLNYIDHVLPALGETGVVLKSLDDFFPDVSPRTSESNEAARIKGKSELASVVANAVSLYQRTPSRRQTVNIDGVVLNVDPSLIAASIARGQQSRLPHNEARSIYAKDALRRLARQLAGKLNLSADDDTLTGLVADLRENSDIRRIVNFAWLPRTPEQLIGRLLTDADFLSRAAPTLPADERATIRRNDPHAWTTSDIPLLDEAAELLGIAELATSRGERASDERGLAYARAALADSGIASSMITAEQYAARFTSAPELAPIAERAQADRGWVYGHVVVDEAQELTAMQWRMVMRRAPNRSMTIVGDPAQASSPGAVANWSKSLGPYVADRWHKRTLTVNYRTPRRVMDVAARFHEESHLVGSVPTAVREGNWPVDVIATPDLTQSLRETLRNVQTVFTEGTIAVIASETTQADIGSVVAEASRRSSDSLAQSVSLITPAQAKGLEFDVVVVVEPATWAPARRDGDIYVALTRATQKLTILHDRPLPWALSRCISTPPPPAATAEQS